MQGSILGVPIIRVIVFADLYEASHFLETNMCT